MEHFHIAVPLILSKWASLSLALQLSSLPTSKATELSQLVIDYFQGKPDMDELADNLLIYFQDEFSVILEDESHLTVAQSLMTCYTEIVINRNISYLDQISREKCEPFQFVAQENDDEDEDMETLTNTPVQTPKPKKEEIVDDDGFILVQRRR